MPNPHDFLSTAGLAGLLRRQNSGTLGEWSQALPQPQGLMGITPGGAAFINPLMMAQAHNAARARYDLLVRFGLIKPFEQNLIRENSIPTRPLQGALTQFPAGDLRTAIPNVYRGALDSHEPRIDNPTNWKYGI